ncbi:BlaI/MecI/CopY family transcriptional regulator [Leptolyngbya cf. ectocarpi LEGE 11479]|uniref:BlaI/MecI/CopY family transcriptional regulator n=1 Tax=Leptolyngbya cf. ectocarpi LEGE 11479 TaxID=1828722 RepID=A0A928X238_LEPEC|nr:BlaI/MecI/CopY family transcriptional regulator [Leptolyngbya ectocarpi]MBE9065108.1 BlaI/MecI/CopY family transcriptional regulator [Leptolyngbya cf. ectocarpi LEGE 11479]
MSPFPAHRPKRLTLGPLEAEILNILWDVGTTSATVIHNHILEDIDRDLTYSSVATVLRRLEAKGWIAKRRVGRAYHWEPLLSAGSAKILQSHERLQQFLAASNPDIVAAFADSLDQDSLDQLEAITLRIQTARRAQKRQEEQP